jgi:hypothetical protein
MALNNIDFVVKNGLVVSTTATIESTTNAVNTSTGALHVAGGTSIVKDLWVGGVIYGEIGGNNVSGAVGSSTNADNVQINNVDSFSTTSYYVTLSELKDGNYSPLDADAALTYDAGSQTLSVTKLSISGGILTGSARITNNVSVGGSVSINGSSATISILSFNGVSFLTDSVHAFSGGEIVVPQTSGLGLVSGTTYYVPAVLSPTRFQLSRTPGGPSTGTVGVSTILANTGPGPGLRVTGGVESTGTNTGAVLVEGGVGISGNLNVGGRIIGGGIRTTTSATAPQNPTVGDVWYNTTNDAVYRYTDDGSGEIYWIDTTGAAVVNFTADMLAGITAGATGNSDNILVNNVQPGNTYYVALTETKDGTYSPLDADTVLTYNSTNHQVSAESLLVTDNAAASSTITGALQVIGGVGIGGSLYAGNIYTNGQLVSAVGPQGPTGNTGAQGPQGVTGPQGPTGNTGAQGPQGPQGNTGAQGPQGVTGPQGPTGNTGAQGPQGPTGNTGAQGPQGVAGPQGPSRTNQDLYTTSSVTFAAISVGNNTSSSSTSTGALQVIGGVGIGGNLYVGGEIVAQKLTIEYTTVTTTLVKTDDVIQTTNNTAASSTTTGALIVTGGVGIGGALYAGNIYTNGQLVSAVGPTGPQGPQGNTGAQGPQGVTGPQGPIGNTGAQGPQGPTGNTGAQGPQGPTGNTGAQGPQGPQGNTGAQGPQGVTGPQGPQGNTGAQGPQGPQGNTGVQGPQGVTGPQGPTGNTGPQGPQGPGNPLATQFTITNTTSATSTITGALQVAGGAGIGGNTVVGGAISAGTAIPGVAGEIRASNEITAYYSDRRLKENVQLIGNAVVKVLSLNGITYTPNDLAESFGYDKNKKLVGLFADEVKAILPEAVRPAPFDDDGAGGSKSGEHYQTIQYEKIVPLLIEAIKELKQEIEMLKKRY